MKPPPWLGVLCLVGLPSCIQQRDTSQFVPIVNRELTPTKSSFPDRQGNSLPIASSRDAQGVTSDFVVGVVRLLPKDDADLQAFLARYDGTVIADDAIPEPPPNSGVTLMAEQRKATQYVVRINLDIVDASHFAADGMAEGLSGRFEVSSDAGLRTLAAVEDAVAAGFKAAPDYMMYPQEDSPYRILQSIEGAAPPTYTNDAFKTPQFEDQQSNVTRAWKFIAARGFSRRVTIAIIDSGFWLNPDGTGRGNDSDFPLAPANILQYDFVDNDAIADGTTEWGCEDKEHCDFWHGAQCFSVAMGILNNGRGHAGTGGLVADPMLLKVGGTKSQRWAAVHYAVTMGADVVSMSFGGSCNDLCRIADRSFPIFDLEVGAGSKTVFVAGAGNDDEDVDEEFFHPCTEDHVICVGALDGATGKANYSNYGNHVALFAPSDIPVMALPADDNDDPNSPTAAGTFSGTSASTPFIAGVAAMMKAINPDLNSDQIRSILIETARPGVGLASRYIDAYAAVHKAAENISGVPDRFESNDTEQSATLIPESHDLNELSFHIASDVDYFRIDVPGPSTLRVQVLYEEKLGSVELLKVSGPTSCSQPILLSDADLGGLGHRWDYKVSGGPQVFALRGSDVTVYRLLIGLTSNPVDADIYEPNDQPAAAKRLQSFKQLQSGSYGYLASDPRFSIDASIHSPEDVDHYTVRGVTMSLAEQVLLVGAPALTLFGNEATATLEVYKLGANSTPGALVYQGTSASCGGQPTVVSLDANVLYLVKISGGVGRYKLLNGVVGDVRHMPSIVHNKVYEVLHPGEPIEHVVRFVELYVFPADKSFTSVRVGAGVHTRLFDIDGNVIAVGAVDGSGETLTLANTVLGQVYALEVTPDPGTQEPELDLSWDQVAATRTSQNLVSNFGAEVPNPNQDIPDWVIVQSTPTVYSYADTPDHPSPTGPGPQDRGTRLFSGGPGNTLSQISQTIFIDPSWAQAINEGRVKFKFSAFLGGLDDLPDQTDVRLTFMNANMQTLAVQFLPSVSAAERDSQSGLLPVQASDSLPVGTGWLQVDLTFHGSDGQFNHAYADNIEMILSEFAP